MEHYFKLLPFVHLNSHFKKSIIMLLLVKVSYVLTKKKCIEGIFGGRLKIEVKM